MEKEKTMNKRKSTKNDNNISSTDPIAIVCYTDPLCCWSWGMQPQLQQLLANYSGQITIDYVMGGLISDWNEFSDPLNSIHKPAQMGPMWMQASHLTGRAIDDLIWIKDPPSSSYPACMAVKTAQLQSKEAGEQMLYWLSKAVMEEGKNIARIEVIAEVAEQLSEAQPGLYDRELFEKEYNGEQCRQSFIEDLNKVKLNKIGRFPTLTLSCGSKNGIMITGFRPYEALLEAVTQVRPL
jgi:predicted DsbA family dithiol-disulfide isomerase